MIKAIENQSEFLFFYQEQHVDLTRQVTLHVTDQDVETILNQLFAETGNIYVINDRQIVIGIAPRKELEKQIQRIDVNLKPVIDQPQQKEVNGKVTDTEGLPLPGVSIVVKGTTVGTVTNPDGGFTLSVPSNAETLQFSFVGMKAQEVALDGRTVFTVVMEEEMIGVDEVIVVGYGSQKKSDITGTVASVSKERLEMVPNINIAQAIQGAIPGVMIQTTSTGARPSEAIMIRGRNSILADNTPLIILDGIPYPGNLNDLNPNNVQSIEVLKDASAAAIYGSRGSNGVILITTKSGSEGKTKISYDGKFSVQDFTNLPDIMDGEQFYKAKMERSPSEMTNSEQAVYDSGKWVDWLDLALRKGFSHQHNLSISGGSQNTKYFISGNLLDVKGIMINDKFKRMAGMINVDTKIKDWLSVGTRTNISYNDMSGSKPSISDVFWTNPLATAYDEDGNLTITPVLDDPVGKNPLEAILFKNIDKSWQILSNNFLIIDVPFIQGLSYRLNTGIRISFNDQGTYRGRDTKTGLDAGGSASTNRANSNNSVVENIFSYSKEFAEHNIFATGVFSYEENKGSSNSMSARNFPNDFLGWYSSSQAEVSIPEYSYNQTNLISQMLRLNYAYASKYLMTASVRRDGYSGFGAKNKWGIFPSIALGWNINNEQFFPWKDLFSELKLRLSYGLNGNQAVGAYQTISRLSQENTVGVLDETVPGYKPSKLGSDNLGWEASSTFNLGVDFKILSNRITGAINMYNTNTTDLLLNRTISPVHGITSITQNIGKTENKGLELDAASRNIVKGDFRWSTSGNLALVKNKIVSLYGELDDEGVETDDIVNKWFIGKPIRVNYDYVFNGIWQLDEADEAAKYNTQPGYVKLKDVDGDGALSADDRQIIGQEDPKLLWGLTNSLSYRNFTLDIFIHGVNGITKQNTLRADHVTAAFRRNTTFKNYWTPTNPTNDFHANDDEARRMSGIIATYYENASFIRVKDISFSFNFPSDFIKAAGIDRLRAYVNGRNLFTFTEWGGLDPELPDQVTIPLQKEFVFGLEIGF